ncbi:MAG: D-alanyl-D-alanine endopeptidase [Nitrosomonadales bacterium]|nr:MAG: D-alanyl-D-alanine endopeptidase [Nitrosomonadales bacterium]
MGRSILLLGCMLFALSPLTAVAANAVHKAKAISAKGHVKSASKRVYSHRILSTLRASKRYRMQTVSYDRNESIFQGEEGGSLRLESSKALILNQDTGEVLYAKSTDVPTPIASVTKLMTAMVMLDAHLPMDEPITVSESDIDMLKGTGSRLRVDSTLTRAELLQLALMSSENRAAAALARTTYPQGVAAFVVAMNRKAAELGMTRSHFADGTGLNSENVSTAEDLAKMVKAAYQYPEIRQVTTTASYDVPVHGLRRPVEFRNTNVLVRNSTWDIGLSKTGYISESGRCLVMQAQIAGQPLIIVLLDSWGKYSRIGDAQRIKKWIESSTGDSRRRTS